MFTFQDFTTLWTDKVNQNTQRDAISSYMRRQLEVFKLLLPILKICGGESFEKDHWRDLFTLLHIPKEAKVETLTFGHLLDSEAHMIAKINDIKELHARAQVD